MLQRHAIIPYNDLVFQEVRRWYFGRGRELEAPPTKPAMGLGYVVGVDSEPLLVATLVHYLSPVWLLIEHGTTNPYLPKTHATRRLLHHASCQLLEASVCTAASLGVKATMLLHTPSLRCLARRCGFVLQPAGHWSRMPVVPVMFNQEDPMQPPEGNLGASGSNPEQATNRT